MFMSAVHTHTSIHTHTLTHTHTHLCVVSCYCILMISRTRAHYNCYYTHCNCYFFALSCCLLCCYCCCCCYPCCCSCCCYICCCFPCCCCTFIYTQRAKFFGHKHDKRCFRCAIINTLPTSLSISPPLSHSFICKTVCVRVHTAHYRPHKLLW